MYILYELQLIWLGYTPCCVCCACFPEVHSLPLVEFLFEIIWAPQTQADPLSAQKEQFASAL